LRANQGEHGCKHGDVHRAKAETTRIDERGLEIIGFDVTLFDEID
jgi:hypothetical protein